MSGEVPIEIEDKPAAVNIMRELVEHLQDTIEALKREIVRNGDRLAKGEVLTAKDVYFITAPKFSTSSKKYDWLNHIQAVGKMIGVQAGKFVKYDVFTVR
jgi:hypothetical protein